MSLSGTLPVELESQIDECAIPDKFEGLRGPVTVEPLFLEELARIDPRLVLRWNPHIGRYLVYIKFPASRKIWSQPTHTVQAPDGGFRKPDKRDLDLIRRANWYAQKDGSKHWIDHIDRLIKDQERQKDAGVTKACQNWAKELCRREDISLKDFQQFGVSRYFASSGTSRSRK